MPITCLLRAARNALRAARNALRARNSPLRAIVGYIFFYYVHVIGLLRAARNALRECPT